MRLNQILRSLARMPLFTGVAVLTLAIGIGANTAIFSVIEGVLLKPLPYPHPDELVVIDHAAPASTCRKRARRRSCTSPIARTARPSRTSGSGIPARSASPVSAEPEEVPTLFVTDGVLPMLGVPADARPCVHSGGRRAGWAETVVLTSGYWHSKFGGDQSVIGRTLMLDSQPREIIGVLPDTFRFLDRHVSLVVPFRLDRSKVFLGQFSYSAIARLKPGLTIEQASADVARLIPDLADALSRRFPAAT